ncbi:hypothetical protein CRENBAI_004441 [Crenichthys baileyi]|uniref:Uncharacterized protein n=1 Tax=Crenichthys baileyi TaxID=28760 RepID=A0AAV9SFM0_9TELE
MLLPSSCLLFGPIQPQTVTEGTSLDKDQADKAKELKKWVRQQKEALRKRYREEMEILPLPMLLQEMEEAEGRRRAPIDAGISRLHSRSDSLQFASNSLSHLHLLMLPPSPLQAFLTRSQRAFLATHSQRAFLAAISQQASCISGFNRAFQADGSQGLISDTQCIARSLPVLGNCTTILPSSSQAGAKERYSPERSARPSLGLTKVTGRETESPQPVKTLGYRLGRVFPEPVYAVADLLASRSKGPPRSVTGLLDTDFYAADLRTGHLKGLPGLVRPPDHKILRRCSFVTGSFAAGLQTVIFFVASLQIASSYITSLLDFVLFRPLDYGP